MTEKRPLFKKIWLVIEKNSRYETSYIKFVLNSSICRGVFFSFFFFYSLSDGLNDKNKAIKFVDYLDSGSCILIVDCSPISVNFCRQQRLPFVNPAYESVSILQLSQVVMFGLFMSWRSRLKGSVFLMFQNQSLKEVRTLRCILSRVSAASAVQVKINSSLITNFRILFNIFPTSFIVVPS